jgi:hypothetical protein
MKPVAAHVWDRDPESWYVEPDWCSARLFEVESFDGRMLDPCAGSGAIVRSAIAAGLHAEAADLRLRGAKSIGVPGSSRTVPVRIADFFSRADFLPGTFPVANIVCNPPYGPDAEGGRWEERFIELALGRVQCKLAVFLPAVWACGSRRSRWLEGLPWYRLHVLSPRPSCPPGSVLASGAKAGGGTTDYAWFVFLRGFSGSPTVHFLRRDG